MSETEWQRWSEAMAEWQGHPVTELLRGLLDRQIAARKAALQSRWWAGQEVPEAERLALIRLEEWVEDFFDLTADDLRAAIERDDDGKSQRHHAG